MRRFILLAGALALLAAAGVTTLEFRTTTMTMLAQPADAGPLAQHLRDMREEMALPSVSNFVPTQFYRCA
jgi:hypothetical protein